MAVEEPLTRIRQVLEERLGMEAASYLMDRPPGGWSNLVTTDVLDLRLDLLRSELREGMAGVRDEMHVGFASLRSEMSGLREELRSEMSGHWVGLHDLLRRHTAQTTTVLISGLTFFGVLFGILSRT